MAPKKGKKDKGRKGKKGAKGKKGKGKKKAKVAKVPPPSLAKVFMFDFDDEDKFLAYLGEFDLKLPFYILFQSDEDQENNVKNEIINFIKKMQEEPDSEDIILTTVIIKTKMIRASTFSLFPKVHLETLPTIIKWGSFQKLEGSDQCTNPQLLCLFFEREETRKECVSIDKFTDNQEILCPFLMRPEKIDEIPPITVKKGPKKPGKKNKKGAKKKKGEKKKAKSKKKK